jgi:chemotaxis protein methyltransferase CheR
VTTPADRARTERLRAVVGRRLGLQFDDVRVEQLASAARERAEALGVGLDEWLSRVDAGDAAEVRALAERLTVGETYFFRNTNDLRAFVGAVLPERMRARRAERRLRLLSAGCSSGEEPYTLAMLVRQVPELAAWDVRIRGVDVNPAAIARAQAARYGPWSLRQTPQEMRARFLAGNEREVRVAEDVRALVAFEERNLVDDDPRFWIRGAYDVVFCRNVLMYFAPEVAHRVVARIASALAPGGFLFLGHAETLRGVSSDFHLRHSHGTFYYQLREGAEEELAPPTPPNDAAAPEVAVPAPEVDWVEAIQQASARIAALAGAGPVAPREVAQRPAPAPPHAPARVASALELLRQDRASAALAALGGGAEEERDTDVLLLRAVLLASSGDPAAAERACARILELDELNAEAHYVKALCRDHAGDLAGAANHDHYALYLDPTFAMPRLHLGLLAKRAGDLDAARRELSRAVALLAGEDGSRLLLLGGGFGRDALLELCRTELRACGGLP